MGRLPQSLCVWEYSELNKQERLYFAWKSVRPGFASSQEPTASLARSTALILLSLSPYTLMDCGAPPSHHLSMKDDPQNRVREEMSMWKGIW